MSMQQSEGVRATAVISLTGEPAQPSPQKRQRGRELTLRRLRRTAQREREAAEISEAIRLGVDVVPKVRLNRDWQEWEDAALIEHRNNVAAAAAALPHRRAGGIEKRRHTLGLTNKLKVWTTAEDRILRQMHKKVSSAADLVELLPGRTTNMINNHLRRLNLSIPRPSADTGSPVIDAIKDRCKLIGYTMKDLDRLAGTGAYFTRRAWQGSHRSGGSRLVQLSGALVKAVDALGGTLRVDWPDDGECIDTIDVGEGLGPRTRGPRLQGPHRVRGDEQ